MAGINYDTELNDSLYSLDAKVDINRGKVTSYYGIGGFMGKVCTCLDVIEEEINNIKDSYYEYNRAINDVPLPLSPSEVEQSLAGETKYKYSKLSSDGEIL